MASASCCREKRPPNGERGGGKRTTERLSKADAQCTPPSRDPTRANAGGHATQKFATPPPERARPKRVGSAQKRPSPRGARRGCPSRASDAGWRAIRATRHPRRRPREGGARRGAGHAWATYDLGLSGFPLPKGQTNARTPPSYKCLPPLHTNVVFLSLERSLPLSSSAAVGPSSSRRFCTAIIRQHGPPAQRLQIRSGRL